MPSWSASRRSSRAIDKVKSCLEPPHVRFVEASPFLVLATSSTEGHADVSPRGDAPGFVRVIDATTLAIPERPGNRRFDSLSNVRENPEVGLLFFVPGVNETLRVNGTARIETDAELLEALAHEGKPALAALVVEVREVFHHCARALMRAALWSPESHADASFQRISSTPDSAYTDRLY